jgi:predicted dinucleotide-binding enzyme
MDGLVTPPGSSAAEEIAKLVPDGTPVVKAFSTTFGRTLVAGEVAGQKLDVLIAGDDEAAKEKIAALAREGGMRPIDVGPLHRARQIEQLGFLHISLQDRLGTGFGSAVRFLW